MQNLDDRHPATQQVARFFDYTSGDKHLDPVREKSAALAGQMIRTLPDGPELTAGLRKLLEAKDCFVRAAL